MALKLISILMDGVTGTLSMNGNNRLAKGNKNVTDLNFTNLDTYTGNFVFYVDFKLPGLEVIRSKKLTCVSSAVRCPIPEKVTENVGAVYFQFVILHKSDDLVYKSVMNDSSVLWVEPSISDEPYEF